MTTVADRVQAFVDQPVLASGSFAADVPGAGGSAASHGFLARKASVPGRVMLAVTDTAVHALEPGITWKARRLVASWRREDVRADRDGTTLVLTVPGFWVVRLTPLGAPARAVADLLCD
ncbi:MAG: hypothetical protein ACKV2O_02250 [Acidimicrobiales bacterium]